MLITKKSVFIAACLALAYVGAAQAAPTTFFAQTNSPNFKVQGCAETLVGNTCTPGYQGRDQFVGSLFSVATENVDSLTEFKPSLSGGDSGQLTLFNGAATLHTGSLDASSYDAVVVKDSTTSRNLGRWDTTTTPDVITTDPQDGSESGHTGQFLETRSKFHIVFNDAIKAFGVFIVDMGDFPSTVSACLSKDGLDPYCEDAQLGNDQLLPISSSGGGTALDGNLVFWGFIDNSGSYESIGFLNIPGNCSDTQACEAGNRDGIGFDDLMIGTLNTTPNGTPEPATLALLGMGLLAASRMRRRQH